MGTHAVIAFKKTNNGEAQLYGVSHSHDGYYSVLGKIMVEYYRKSSKQEMIDLFNNIEWKEFDIDCMQSCTKCKNDILCQEFIKKYLKGNLLLSYIKHGNFDAVKKECNNLREELCDFVPIDEYCYEENIINNKLRIYHEYKSLDEVLRNATIIRYVYVIDLNNDCLDIYRMLSHLDDELAPINMKFIHTMNHTYHIERTTDIDKILNIFENQDNIIKYYNDIGVDISKYVWEKDM